MLESEFQQRLLPRQVFKRDVVHNDFTAEFEEKAGEQELKRCFCIVPGSTQRWYQEFSSDMK